MLWSSREQPCAAILTIKTSLSLHLIELKTEKNRLPSSLHLSSLYIACVEMFLGYEKLYGIFCRAIGS